MQRCCNKCAQAACRWTARLRKTAAWMSPRAAAAARRRLQLFRRHQPPSRAACRTVGCHRQRRHRSSRCRPPAGQQGPNHVVNRWLAARLSLRRVRPTQLRLLDCIVVRGCGGDCSKVAAMACPPATLRAAAAAVGSSQYSPRGLALPPAPRCIQPPALAATEAACRIRRPTASVSRHRRLLECRMPCLPWRARVADPTVPWSPGRRPIRAPRSHCPCRSCRSSARTGKV